MAEDPQPMTLQQRIAALNAAHIGRVPGEPPRPLHSSIHGAPPQVPARRPNLVKQHSVNNPPEQVNGSVTDSRAGNLPAPPPTPPVRKAPPPLPSRKSSTDEERRGSVASTISTGTGDSIPSKPAATRNKSSDSANRIKAPAWGECELPALPARGQHTVQRKYSEERPKYVNRAPSSTSLASLASLTPVTPLGSSSSAPEAKVPPARPSLPPRLPSRGKPETEHREHAQDTPTSRKLPPMPTAEALERAKKAAFSCTFKADQPSRDNPRDPPRGETQNHNQQPPVHPVHLVQPTQPVRPIQLVQPVPSVPAGQPERPTHTPQPAPSVPAAVQPPRPPKSAPPPPVPLGSRPDLSAIQATKPRLTSSPPINAPLSGTTSECLVCRDFSAPDHRATLFPRQNVTSLQALAYDLTSAFPSATDKARAIFTWLHLNIQYDVVSFFNHSVKPSTPNSTLQTGLAVCEGFAALFTTIATHAGLESVVIGGHGKGYGHSQLAPGSPIPPYSAGHAWNAVRIDHGEWKLIDCCWGAGNVSGAGQPYNQQFTPRYFTMSNEEFGIKHFPENKDHFFLPGGRRMTWVEYIVIDHNTWPDMVEPPTLFINAHEDYTISQKTILPRSRKINVRQAGNVKFQFGLLCPHWTLERHTRKGPPPVFLVQVEGVDGRKKDLVPVEYYPGGPHGGDTWAIDIPARELGAPGQTVSIFALTRFGDRHECRGLTIREFKEGKGRVAMGFVGVAAWELV